MAVRAFNRIGPCCAAAMLGLYLLVPGWAQAHWLALVPIIVPGAIWTARHCSDAD